MKKKIQKQRALAVQRYLAGEEPAKHLRFTGENKAVAV